MPGTVSCVTPVSSSPAVEGRYNRCCGASRQGRVLCRKAGRVTLTYCIISKCSLSSSLITRVRSVVPKKTFTHSERSCASSCIEEYNQYRCKQVHTQQAPIGTNLISNRKDRSDRCRHLLALRECGSCRLFCTFHE